MVGIMNPIFSLARWSVYVWFWGLRAWRRRDVGRKTRGVSRHVGRGQSLNGLMFPII